MTTARPAPLNADDYQWTVYDRTQAYIAAVLSGEAVVGVLQRQAVERHQRDLEFGPARGLYFDEPRAMKVFRFFSLLKHWKGEWAGSQFLLEGWQGFCIWSIFGWVKAADDLRRFRTAYVQVGKKNGKTLLGAGIAYYMFAADGEPGAEVYTAATKRDQAKLSHTDAVQMRSKSPTLRARHDYFKASDNISNPLTGSKFEPLGANKDSTDGVNPHCALIDEVHRHKDPGLIKVLEYSMAARRQPLLLQITTAGDDSQSYCYEQREYCSQVLSGAVDADDQFAFVAEIDEGDDWRDERVWPKANPCLGVSKKLDAMRQRLRSAKHVPSEAVEFRRYECNEWVVGALEGWITVDAWKGCPPGELALPPDRPCYGGMDLAATQDICALALYFPPTDDDPLAHLRLAFFVPDHQIVDRERQYKVPLRRWIEEGHVQTTPGRTINTQVVVNQMLRWKRRYDVLEVGYDDWNANDAIRMLEAGDDDDEAADAFREEQLIPLPQTVKTFNAPMSRIEDLVTDGRLMHGHNPAMLWMLSNVRVASDGSGRKKPMKHEGKRARKIDGIVAMLNAVARQMVDDDDDGTSVYERRGIVDLSEGVDLD